MVTSIRAIVTVMADITIIAMTIIQRQMGSLQEMVVICSLFMVSLTAITRNRDGTTVVLKTITVVGSVQLAASPVTKASVTTIALLAIGSKPTYLPPRKKQRHYQALAQAQAPPILRIKVEVNLAPSHPEILSKGAWNPLN